MDITKKEDRFCQEYIIDYNGTKAAIRAGYSEKTARVTASKLLSKANIAARVRQLQKEQADRLQLSADLVLTKLYETLSRCMQAQPVTEWDYDEHKMVETGEYTFDSKGATKALELIGKHLGMFAERKEVRLTDGVMGWFKDEDMGDVKEA